MKQEYSFTSNNEQLAAGAKDGAGRRKNGVSFKAQLEQFYLNLLPLGESEDAFAETSARSLLKSENNQPDA